MRCRRVEPVRAKHQAWVDLKGGGQTVRQGALSAAAEFRDRDHRRLGVGE
jgi:hypothetical protein